MTVRAPAHVAPYVEALGEARAVAFLIAFGGAPAYLAERPGRENRIVPVIGADGLAALVAEFGPRIDRVPVAKPWIAAVWSDQGLAVIEIARRLHTTDKTVRGWLKPLRADREARREAIAAQKARQGDLIDWLENR
ncbi:hypothetical protein [Pinisolibacter sp.]|uniref:hypothetical protein n=1 Tax=Pinisolibacter sp. TaxID=2172024 RepID=UPI002FDD1BDB